MSDIRVRWNDLETGKDCLACVKDQEEAQRICNVSGVMVKCSDERGFLFYLYPGERDE